MPLNQGSPCLGKLPFVSGNPNPSKTIFGVAPLTMLRTTPPSVAFALWAGTVGLIVLADTMKVLTHAGEVPLSEIPAAHRKWWEYWREYWDRKDSTNPMPQDFACEVIIPIK